VQLSDGPDAWLSKATMGIQEAPLTHQIADRGGANPDASTDPADRLLMSNEKLRGLGTIRALANR